MIGKSRSRTRAVSEQDVSQHAQRLFAAGDTREAVRVFVQAGRYREAAHILKHTGYVEAAARYYVKGKAFDLAEGCYLTLGDRLNAAHCASAGGQPGRAAIAFEELGDRRSAAQAYARAGDWLKAARLFHRERLLSDAASAYGEWLRRAGESHRSELPADDVLQIVDSLSCSPFTMELVRFVISRGQATALVIALLEQGRLSLAIEVYEQQRSRLGIAFVDWTQKGPQHTERGLMMATKVGDPLLQAQILERCGRSADAAQAYLAAGDYAKAYACCLKTEDWAQIERMKAMIAARGETMPGVQLKAFREAVETHSSMMSRPRSFSLGGRSDIAQIDVNPDTAAAVIDVQATVVIEADAAPVASDGELTPVFMDSKLFRDLGLEERRTLWSIGSVLKVAAGSIIVDSGMVPAGSYTLLAGTLEVQRLSDDGYRVVDRIAAGQNFGETWLLVGRRSEVRIVASEDCRVHIVERQRLEHVQLGAASDTARLMKRLAVSLLSHLLVSYGSEGALVLAGEGQL